MPYFGQILDSDGTVLLCLHQWGAHEHPSLTSPDEATPGNGLLLFFRVDDFDMSLKRARALVARLEEEPHANPNTRTQEFSLRDPDGYYVTISELSSLESSGYPTSVRVDERLPPDRARRARLDLGAPLGRERRRRHAPVVANVSASFKDASSGSPS